MDPYTPRTRPVGRKKNLALSTKEYSKVRTSFNVIRTVFDVYHHRLQEQSHLQDGAATWSMASTTNGTDVVDTIFFPKVQANASVRHLLALIAIRSFVHCGDILRQSPAELTSSITFIHNTQDSRERKIARGKPGQRVPGYSRGPDPGRPTLCSDGKGSTCSNRACLPHTCRGSKGHTSHTIRTTRLKTMTPFAESSSRFLRRLVHHDRFISSEPSSVNPPFTDPSLSDLVERILPLATYYTGITSFVELRSHLEYGLVNHALCASIRDMLKVWLETVCL